MDRPLGRAVGNVLEVIEAIETLRGGGPPDLRALALHEAAHLLMLTGTVADDAAGMQLAAATIASGAAFAKFQQVVAAQDGDPEALGNRALLPHAPVVFTVAAPETGFIADIEPRLIGEVAMHLGAGRVRKGDTIDPAVGIVLHATLGDRIAQGEPLFTIYARNVAAAGLARNDALAAYRVSPGPVAVPPLIKATITEA
jgi:thymidine phosphorylase